MLKVNESVIKEIKSLREKNIPYRTIAKKLNLCLTTILRWSSDERLERSRQTYKRYYKNNRESRKASVIKYRKKHRKELSKKTSDLNKKRRLLVLNHYCGNNKLGPWCQCCGETIYGFLTLEHIKNDGSKHRRKLGGNNRMVYKWIIDNNFPSGFEVLCMNCNCAKSWYGKCPHKSGDY